MNVSEKSSSFTYFVPGKVEKGIKGKFILSYNDNEMIRELYRDFEIVKINRNNTLSSKTNTGEYKEFVIKNF